jgi:hypothetical protein
MIARSGNLYTLAEGCGRVGRVEEGLQLVAEGFTMVKRNGERAWEAELYRVKGDLLLMREGESPKPVLPAPVPQAQVSVVEGAEVEGQKSKMTDPRSPTPDSQAEAEACFLKAIEIAQRQQGKLHELRALLSLVKLWRAKPVGGCSNSTSGLQKGLRPPTSKRRRRCSKN